MHRQSPNRLRADLEMGVRGVRSRREREIAELAARQRGVVTRTQLLRIGLTRDAIDNRVKSSRLHPLYRAVYLLGHPRPTEGARELAAALSCGPGAVVSHRSAAGLWRLLPEPTGDPDVTVPERDCRRERGIRVHLVAALDRRDVRTVRGIPVTTPARTLLDLAAAASRRELERALAEAEARRLTRRNELLALLARVGARPGASVLRALVEADMAPSLIRSEAEERFLALISAAELPTPEANVRVGPYEVDFLWRDQGLIVEVDGFRFHSSRASFERDRRRDAELVSRGYRAIRVTWRQIVDRPEALVARIAAALRT
jgi:predicted transcriptional regulator of viral defense system